MNFHWHMTNYCSCAVKLNNQPLVNHMVMTRLLALVQWCSGLSWITIQAIFKLFLSLKVTQALTNVPASMAKRRRRWKWKQGLMDNLWQGKWAFPLPWNRVSQRKCAFPAVVGIRLRWWISKIGCNISVHFTKYTYYISTLMLYFF